MFDVVKAPRGIKKRKQSLMAILNPDVLATSYNTYLLNSY